jgi:hypothetical protein
VAVGPLVLWEAAQIYEHDGETLIAPTQAGLDLLAQLEGLSLDLPHSADHTRSFLEHLQRHAPKDLDSLRRVATVVSREPNRDQLIREVGELPVADSAKLVDVYAQAYLARGREWGVFEPRLIAGRYRLTDGGAALLGV